MPALLCYAQRGAGGMPPDWRQEPCRCKPKAGPQMARGRHTKQSAATCVRFIQPVPDANPAPHVGCHRHPHAPPAPPMRAYGRAWMALRSNGAMPLLLRAARYRAHYRTPAPARRSARLAGCRGLQGPCGAADGPRAGCCALMLPQAPAGPWWPVARPAAPCKAKPRIARCFAALHVSQLRARLVCPRWCSARGRGPCRVVARATASARRPAALQRQAAA